MDRDRRRGAVRGVLRVVPGCHDIGHAGCHGGDWAEVVERVTVVDDAGREFTLADIATNLLALTIMILVGLLTGSTVAAILVTLLFFIPYFLIEPRFSFEGTSPSAIRKVIARR